MSGSTLPDAHRAVSLHVGVPAYREQAAARLTDVALREPTFTTSLMVATPLRCWVSPIAQQNTVRSESRSICGFGDLFRGETGRDMLLPHVEAGRVPGDEVVSRASDSTSSAPNAWNNARSPLSLISRCRSSRSVPRTTTPRGTWGFLKLTRPTSRSGLIEMILHRCASRFRGPRASGDGWCRGSVPR
jgi:hypothetical protein